MRPGSFEIPLAGPWIPEAPDLVVFGALLPWISDDWLAFGGFLILALIGIALFIAMRREESETFDTDADLLEEFEEARAAGELDESEFLRVRDVLRGRIEADQAVGKVPGQGEPPRPSQAPGLTQDMPAGPDPLPTAEAQDEPGHA